MLLPPHTDTAIANEVSVLMEEHVRGAVPVGSVGRLIRTIKGMGEVDDTAELGRMGVEVLAAA